VQQEKLLVQTNPDYPSLAKTSRVEGVVTLKAVIAADGTVKELEPVSGHPLLLPAAIQAVKQWRYRPTMVNGAPVEVVTQVDVQFTLQP
jgi:protein TonB